MKCKACKTKARCTDSRETAVPISRDIGNCITQTFYIDATRRRYACPECGTKITTYEIIGKELIR